MSTEIFDSTITAEKIQSLEGKKCIAIGLGSSIFSEKRGLPDLINKYCNFKNINFTPSFWFGKGGARIQKDQESFLDIIKKISLTSGCKSLIIYLYIEKEIVRVCLRVFVEMKINMKNLTTLCRL